MDDVGKRKLARTVGFVVVVGGVLAAFLVLGQQGRPPRMPPTGPHHQLRLNLKGELIGVETDPPVDPAHATAGQGFNTDKKAVETRVSFGCQACHGAPGTDLSGHACAQAGGRCIGPHHPPKLECIKCHR